MCFICFSDHDGRDFHLETGSTKRLSEASGSKLLHVVITRSGLSHHVDHDSFLVRMFVAAHGDRLTPRYAQRNSVERGRVCCELKSAYLIQDARIQDACGRSGAVRHWRECT